jgi:hypothetical protein
MTKRRNISSSETFFAKFILPPAFFGGVGLLVFGLFTGAFLTSHDPSPPWELKWILLIFWIIGSVGNALVNIPLKKVSIDDTGIIVSNYMDEVKISFNQIVDVTEKRWSNGHPVTIHLRQPNPFGKKIVFLPTIRLFCWFGLAPHPIVKELRMLADIDAQDARK